MQVNEQNEKAHAGSAKDVDVLLDFQKADFVTQPGAFRRIVMNIFGNALKYTSKGTIMVKMELHSDAALADSDANTQDTVLEIKIIDTGKGISREYLRTKLYSPFSQEDLLASGTWLGLSIVRSICNVLRGDIDVQSELGEGTQVTIRLLMGYPPVSRQSSSFVTHEPVAWISE